MRKPVHLLLFNVLESMRVCAEASHAVTLFLFVVLGRVRLSFCRLRFVGSCFASSPKWLPLLQ
jgi:hypothetical protein